MKIEWSLRGHPIKLERYREDRVKKKYTRVEESEEEVHVCGGEKKEKEKERHVWIKTNKEIKRKIK